MACALPLEASGSHCGASQKGRQFVSVPSPSINRMCPGKPLISNLAAIDIYAALPRKLGR